MDGIPEIQHETIRVASPNEQIGQEEELGRGSESTLRDQGTQSIGKTPRLSIRALHKAYVGRKGKVEVLKGLDFSVAPGEFLSLLGPSGCGKTTTLNVIAGFIESDTGHILVDGEEVTDVPPHRRDIALVFQNYSLFPHMTVEDNVSFGLRMARRRKRLSKRAIDERVAYVLGLVELPHVANRYPAELSGGQQQRVGLARALAVNPSVLLLDEPLSNLDAPLRKSMQVQLRRIIDEVAITTVYVTHDQEEALALSDRVIVMREGRIEQAGTPRDIYEFPVSSYVAAFVGESNLLNVEVVAAEGSAVVVRSRGGAVFRIDADISGFESGEALQLVFRPEHVTLKPLEGGNADSGGRLTETPLTGVILSQSYLGSSLRIMVDAGPDGEIFALTPSSAGRVFAAGVEVEMTVDSQGCVLLAAEPGKEE